MPFGCSNEYLITKIKEQTDKLPFSNLLGLVADIQKKYAINLTGYMGDFTSVLYTCSGSEAIEAAIKTCRKYQSQKGRMRRKMISAFALSYHGTSYGAMSISGIDRVITEDYQPVLPQVQWIDVPKDFTDEKEWIRIIDHHFLQYGDIIAGMIIEPVLASGGVVIVPKEALKHLQQLCNKNDSLFVLDEVATGFGRTGVPFVFQKYDLQPDLVCLSKAINNGYLPLGALVYSSILSEYFVEKNTVIEHFSTQGGNLAAISAACAMLDLMKEYEKYDVGYKGNLFLEILKEELADKENILVHGVGLMIAIDFPVYTTGESLLALIGMLQKRGILVYMYNNPYYNCGISIFPPFIIMEEEIIKYAHMIAKNLKRFISL
jgi:adenosylmethionine-8-amino-7-oxononanoate aminotransferase